MTAGSSRKKVIAAGMIQYLSIGFRKAAASAVGGVVEDCLLLRVR